MGNVRHVELQTASDMLDPLQTQKIAGVTAAEHVPTFYLCITSCCRPLQISHNSLQCSQIVLD